MSKARVIIAENILILKYLKHATTAVLNEKDTLMLLPISLRKPWMYQVWPIIVSRDTSAIWNKKFLIGNFTGVLIMNFVPDWESEIVNQFHLQTSLSEN